MSVSTEDSDSMLHEVAMRFSALGRLFADLGTTARVAEVLDAVTGVRSDVLKDLADTLEIGMLGKCYWLRDVIEVVIRRPPKVVTECYVREDLTPADRRLLLMIAWRFRQNPKVSDETASLTEAGRTVIPPGPFLDELKANHLVTCETRMVSDSITRPALGKPERVCL